MLSADDTYFAALRQREFGRLDAQAYAYLDYGGAALYPDSLVHRHAERLVTTVYGNPHSDHQASRESTEVVANARASVLRWLDADPADYAVVFTANASAALHLLGESYQFGPRSPLVLSADNHNSVNGLRRFAERRQAPVSYLPLDDALGIDAEPGDLVNPNRGRRGLFAFPSQSNFSGVRHSLNWIAEAQARGYDVLLDAAAAAHTTALSLRSHSPEFVVLSLYKVVGYPTGVGALVARHDALARLERPWFAGGTVEYVRVKTADFQLKPDAEGFEDGTVNFLALASVPDSLEFVREVGYDRVRRHVAMLAASLLHGLAEARHPNGAPRVRVYGPGITPDRGGTVAFNLLDAEGQVVPFGEVESAARAQGVAVRGGCFCNPGAAEHAFATDGATGALRASLGVANNACDVSRLLAALAV